MNNKISNAMRFFFFVLGSVILLGTWLTGFDKTHWLLYVPVVFLYFAAISGICPGLVFSDMLFPSRAPAKTATRTRRKKH